MKQCPRCRIDLVRFEYEDFQIENCPNCRGHLIKQRRLDGIKRSKKLTTEELKVEAKREFKASSPEKIRCPRCHVPMEKERADSPISIYLDRCAACNVLWLDGGELALVQLAYEAGQKSLDAAEMKRRMEDLEASPERKKEFEENLDKLPPGKTLIDPISEGLWDGLWEGLRRGLFRIYIL